MEGGRVRARAEFLQRAVWRFGPLGLGVPRERGMFPLLPTLLPQGSVDLTFPCTPPALIEL